MEKNVEINCVCKGNGITLIALVITIIIMLILAGVTISIVVNGGLFKQASDAVRLTDIEAIIEQIEMDLVAIIMEKGEALTEVEVNDILGKYTSSGLATIEDGKIIFADLATKKGNEFTLEDLTIFGVGNNGGNTNANALANYAEPGDKVIYGSVNGYSGEWRVLYNDGTNVSIISMSSVDTITLNGKNDYNDVVSKLRTESEAYMNSFAQSARSVGSNPDGTDGRGATTLAYQDNDNFAYIQTHASDMKAGDTNYNGSDSGKNIDFSNLDYTTMTGLGIANIGTEYWLASRSVGAGSSGVAFNVRIVNSGGDWNYCYLWTVSSGGSTIPNDYAFGLRPVITLGSSVLKSGGNGTAGWDIQ